MPLSPNGATSQSKNTSFLPARKNKIHLRQTFFDAKGTPGTRLSFSSPAPAELSRRFPLCYTPPVCFSSTPLQEPFDHETWAFPSRRPRDLRSSVCLARAKATDTAAGRHH